MFADAKLFSKFQQISSVMSKLNGLTDIAEVKEAFNSLQTAMDMLQIKQEDIEEFFDDLFPYRLKQREDIVLSLHAS